MKPIGASKKQPEARERAHDPMWHVQFGAMAVVFLQYLTAPALLPFNKYLITFVELLLVALLLWVTPNNYRHYSRRRRTVALTLIMVVAVGNVLSLLLLLAALMGHSSLLSGPELLGNAVVIYVNNIFTFALLYWEMDGGGPDRRVAGSERDFLFTQMAHPRFGSERWKPGFIDYLYLSASTVTNFASADTVPLSHRAKMLMMSQSFVAVVVVVLVAARAVSILR
jgi:hypothetical protein